MAKLTCTYWLPVAALLVACLLTTGCGKKDSSPTEILTPTTVKTQPTPTPLPRPSWPGAIELKQTCDRLHHNLREQKLDEVRTALPDLAATAENVATATPPERAKNLPMVRLFQNQLLKLARSTRLSPDSSEPYTTPEEVRLYVDGIEYAVRSLIENSGVEVPPDLELSSPALR